MRTGKDSQTLWLLFGALSLEAHFLVGVPQLLDVSGVLQTPWYLPQTPLFLALLALFPRACPHCAHLQTNRADCH
jgi:hypothetical protein